MFKIVIQQTESYKLTRDRFINFKSKDHTSDPQRDENRKKKMISYSDSVQLKIKPKNQKKFNYHYHKKNK